MDIVFDKKKHLDVDDIIKTRTTIGNAGVSNLKNGVKNQIIMSVLVNFTILSSGMGLGYPAITLHSLTNGSSMSTDTTASTDMSLSPSEASWFASINSFACPIGGLMSGYILDKIGRKYTLVVINVFSITSWALLIFASRTDITAMYTQLLASRFLIGITTGLSSSPAAVYSAEIAQPNLRGRLTLLTTFSVGLGILIIYVLGYLIPDNWRLVSSIACSISVASLILLVFVPESPHWLILKGRFNDAKNSLIKLRGYPSNCNTTNLAIASELNLLKEQIYFSKSGAQESVFSTLKQKEVYKPLGIIVGFFAFQQFSGIFVIVVYAAQFAKDVGIAMDPFLCAVLIGVVRVIATVIVAYVLDSLGRKPPSLISGIGMTLCMYGLALCLWLPEITAKASWLPLFLLLTYIFVSTLGFLTIPFAMLAEIFPQKIRGFASGLTICACYMMCFIAVKLYPSMLSIMGSQSVVLLYGSISLIGVLYIYFLLPETKGKTLQEIEMLFKHDKSDYLNNDTKTFTLHT